MQNENRTRLSSAAFRYGSALFALAVATAVRMAFDSALGPRIPFAAYFVAVILVACYAGLGPSLLTVAGGALLGEFLFLRSLGTGDDVNRTGIPQLIAFVVLSTIVCIMVKVIQDARRRAEQNAQALADGRKELATILSSISDAVIATVQQCAGASGAR